MNCLEIPLDIENVKIEQVEFTQHNTIMITVTSTLESTFCHRCGKEIHDFYGYNREIELRHLSILGRPTYLRIKPKRYRCPCCQDHPTTTQKLSWYDARSPHTKAYETHVLLSLVNSTVVDVSIKEGLGYEAVMGIINRHVSPEVNWNEFEDLEIVGVDEIADLYEGYVNAAKEVLGRKVRIVVDRFHVAKLYRKGLDDVRKQELQRLKEELPEETYQEFKGVMWVLRKNPEELEPEERETLKKLFKYTPLLGTAYVLCYALTGIFEQPLTKEEGRRQLRAWKELVKKSGLSCFNSFLKTLDKWMDEITNYFVDRHSSGFVEGLNNKIKVIKRRCYGILNIGHFFQRLFIDLRGYEEYA